MNTKKCVSLASAIALILTISSCKWLFKKPTRETVLDKVVSIPKDLVLDIPHLPPLCDEIKDLKGGYVDVGNNGKLYYEEHGQGIPIVLLSGGPGETHHVFHPYFSKIKDFARVIYYDQRGVGKSSKDETGKTYTIKQTVEDLENLRKALKVDKWIVLGCDYGGFLAQCYSLTYPKNCTGLVLIPSRPQVSIEGALFGLINTFLSKEEQKAIGNVIEKLYKNEISEQQALYNEMLCGGWKGRAYYKPTPDEMTRTALYEWQPAIGLCSLIRLQKLAIDLEGKFDDFEIPTLIIESKRNLAWDKDKTEIIRKNHPNAQFAIFDKSSHRMFADESEKFFDILSKFMKKSNEAKIVYKPSRKIAWPKELSEWRRKIKIAMSLKSDEETSNKLLSLYNQAVQADVKDYLFWGDMFFSFWGNMHFPEVKKHIEESLDSLNRYEKCAKISASPDLFKKIVRRVKPFRGRMLDLLGRRDEAIKCYKEYLSKFDPETDFDKEEIEKYLQEPFTLEPLTLD